MGPGRVFPPNFWIIMKKIFFAIFLFLWGVGGCFCSPPNPSSKGSHAPSNSSPSDSPSSLVQILTSPPGADVEIDGRAYGQTPLKISSLSKEKKHSLYLKKNFYISQKTELLPKEWNFNKWNRMWYARKEISLRLKPLFQNALSEGALDESLKKRHSISKIFGRGLPHTLVLDKRGEQMALGSRNRILLLNPENGKEKFSLGWFMEHQKLCFSAGGTLLASLCRAEGASYLALFELTSQKNIFQQRIPEGFAPLCLTFSRQEDQLALGGGKGVILFRKAEKKWQREKELAFPQVSDLSFFQKGYSLGIVSQGRLYFWNPERKEKKLPLWKNIRRVIFSSERHLYLLLDRDVVYLERGGQVLWTQPLPFFVPSGGVVDFSLLQNRYLAVLIKNQAFQGCVIDTLEDRFSWIGAPYSGKIQNTFLSLDGRFLGVDLTNRIALLDMARMEFTGQLGRQKSEKILQYSLFPEKDLLLELMEGRLYQWNIKKGKRDPYLILKGDYIYPLNERQLLFLRKEELGIFNIRERRVEKKVSLPLKDKNTLFCSTPNGEKVAGLHGNTLWVGEWKDTFSLILQKSLKKKCRQLLFDLQGSRLVLVYKTRLDLIEIPSGKTLSISTSHREIGRTVFSPSGYLLATADRDRPEMEVFDTSNGKKKLQIDSLPFSVSEIVFVPNERYCLVVTHNSRTMVILKINLFNQAWEDIYFPFAQNLSDYSPLAGAFFPKGDQLFLSFSDGTLRSFNPSNYSERYSIYLGEEFSHLQYSQDGRLLIGQSGDQKIFWKKGVPYSFVRSVFSEIYQSVFTVDYTGKKVLSRKIGSKVKREILSLNSPVSILEISPQGKLLGVSTEDGFLRILELSSGKILQKWNTGALTGIKFSLQGNFIALGRYQPSLEIRKFFSPNPLLKLKVFSLPKTFSFLRDDHFLFHDGSNQLVLWDVKVESIVKRFFGVQEESFFISPDKREFLYKGPQNQPYLHTKGGKLVKLPFQNFLVGTFYPRKYIALANSEKVVILDRNSFKAIATFVYGKGISPLALAFPPKGKKIAVAYSDGTVVVWNFAGRD